MAVFPVSIPTAPKEDRAVTLEKTLFQEKLLQWEEALQDFSLPGWDALPALPLYMDQVIYLLNQYLSPVPDQGPERLVTPAMINNYVKLKIIPPPFKKRYGRVHLAYLIVVCVFKQSLNTADIRRLMPPSLPEDAVRALYGDFIAAMEEMKALFPQEVRKIVTPVLRESPDPAAHLVLRAAFAANLAKLLCQQTLRLEPEPGSADSGA